MTNYHRFVSLAALFSELQSIMRFWQFLANYMATLACMVAKLKRAQPGHGTIKGAKFGQNRSTLSTVN